MAKKKKPAKQTEEFKEGDADRLALQTNFYQLFAYVFAAAGIIVFTILYYNYFEGQLIESLKNPKTPVILMVPFLPAAILAIIAERMRQKARRARTYEDQKKQQ